VLQTLLPDHCQKYFGQILKSNYSFQILVYCCQNMKLFVSNKFPPNITDIKMIFVFLFFEGLLTVFWHSQWCRCPNRSVRTDNFRVPLYLFDRNSEHLAALVLGPLDRNLYDHLINPLSPVGVVLYIVYRRRVSSVAGDPPSSVSHSLLPRTDLLTQTKNSRESGKRQRKLENSLIYRGTHTLTHSAVTTTTRAV
jgi:hypothetical protein